MSKEEIRARGAVETLSPLWENTPAYSVMIVVRVSYPMVKVGLDGGGYFVEEEGGRKSTRLDKENAIAVVTEILKHQR